MTPETEPRMTREEAVRLVTGDLSYKIREITKSEEETPSEKRLQTYQEVVREINEINLPKSYPERILTEAILYEANKRASSLVHDFAVQHGLKKLAEQSEEFKSTDLLDELRNFFPETNQLLKKDRFVKNPTNLANLLLAQELEPTDEERDYQVHCFLWKLCVNRDFYPLGFELPDDEIKRIIDIVVYQEGGLTIEEAKEKTQRYLKNMESYGYGFDLPYLILIKRNAFFLSFDPKELDWSHLGEEKLAQAFVEYRNRFVGKDLSNDEIFNSFLELAESMGFTWEKGHQPKTLDNLCIWTIQGLAELTHLRTEEIARLILFKIKAQVGLPWNNVASSWRIIKGMVPEDKQLPMKKELLNSIWESRWFVIGDDVIRRKEIMTLAQECGFQELVEEIEAEGFDEDRLKQLSEKEENEAEKNRIAALKKLEITEQAEERKSQKRLNLAKDFLKKEKRESSQF